MTWKRGIFSFVALVLLLAFPYGPLFAWSPVHPGYLKAHFTRADILYPADRPLDPELNDVDHQVALVENFHNLRYAKKARIVECRDWSDCRRFALIVGAQRPLGVTDITGSVIYLTPSVGKTVDAGGVLRHELSHAVLSQNQGVVRAWRMLKQPWISEGIAGVTASMGTLAPGRMPIALPAAGLILRARKEDLWPTFDLVQQKDWRVSYTGWEFFWKREIERHGIETFRRFESSCTSDPDKCGTSFVDTYGMSLHQAVDEYQNDLRSGTFVPDDRTTSVP